MRCEKCREEIPEKEKFNYGDKTLCEDCYIELISVPKTCDPMKVRSARITRERLGQKGTEGLLPVQKQIYEYLIDKGKATFEEISKLFNLEHKELEKHLSVLRHCELVRGFKKGEKKYLTSMNTEDNAS